MQAKVAELTLESHGDMRGQLIAIESLSDQIPFEIKRVYYIFDTTSNTVRGMHAHRNLRQLLVCVNGACSVECELPNGARSTHRLDWPNKGLLVEGLVWREMKNFSKAATLLVLASEHYDEKDYIRDYDAFKDVASAHE